MGGIEEEKKHKSSGPSKVSCEMFSNEVCVRVVWSSKWPVDRREYARVMEQEHGCSFV